MGAMISRKRMEDGVDGWTCLLLYVFSYFLHESWFSFFLFSSLYVCWWVNTIGLVSIPLARSGASRSSFLFWFGFVLALVGEALFHRVVLISFA